MVRGPLISTRLLDQRRAFQCAWIGRVQLGLGQSQPRLQPAACLAREEQRHRGVGRPREIVLRSALEYAVRQSRDEGFPRGPHGLASERSARESTVEFRSGVFVELT